MVPLRGHEGGNLVIHACVTGNEAVMRRLKKKELFLVNTFEQGK